MRKYLFAGLLLLAACAQERHPASTAEFVEIPVGVSQADACDRVADLEGPLKFCFRDGDRLYYG